MRAFSTEALTVINNVAKQQFTTSLHGGKELQKVIWNHYFPA